MLAESLIWVIGVLLFETSDLDKARAFVSSDDLRQKMQESGVTDKPDGYFLT
jgi:hypothetical protein